MLYYNDGEIGGIWKWQVPHQIAPPRATRKAIMTEIETTAAQGIGVSTDGAPAR